MALGTLFNDTLYGFNSYNDYTDGNSGDDYIYGYSSAGDSGFSGNDTLFGNYGSDVIYGGSGNDYIDGGRYYANIYGAAIADYSYNYLYGGSGNDTILGGYNYDYIDGGSENDILYGLNGNDTIVGGLGNDTLYGGDGIDYLNGYGNTLSSIAQNDTLWGGTGADKFVLGTASGVFYRDIGSVEGYATIRDFSRSEGDKIQVKGSINQYYLAQGASSTTIYFNSGSSYEKVGFVQNTRVSAFDLTSV